MRGFLPITSWENVVETQVEIKNKICNWIEKIICFLKQPGKY
jgi:hypothetical protein